MLLAAELAEVEAALVAARGGLARPARERPAAAAPLAGGAGAVPVRWTGERGVELPAALGGAVHVHDLPAEAGEESDDAL